MIIELFNFNFPGYSVSFCVMFQCDREIAALVKLAEGGGAALALLEGPGQGRPDDRGIAHVRLDRKTKRFHMQSDNPFLLVTRTSAMNIKLSSSTGRMCQFYF